MYTWNGKSSVNLGSNGSVRDSVRSMAVGILLLRMNAGYFYRCGHRAYR